MDERGTKRYAEEEPCPEDGRFGQTPAMAVSDSPQSRHGHLIETPCVTDDGQRRAARCGSHSGARRGSRGTQGRRVECVAVQRSSYVGVIIHLENLTRFQLTLKLMKRVLTAEGRAKTASKAQKDAEALLADSSLQLRVRNTYHCESPSVAHIILGSTFSLSYRLLVSSPE